MSLRKGWHEGRVVRGLKFKAKEVKKVRGPKVNDSLDRLFKDKGFREKFV